MRRVDPKRAAIERSAGPSTRSSSASVASSASETYSRSASGSARDDLADGRPDRLRVALAGLPAGAAGCQGAVEHRGGGALGGREVDVARAHGEPVGLADGGAGDDGREGEVGRHPGDHPQLLGVLHPEVGAVGPDQAEEDRHDGRDAVEVARARRALQRPAPAPTLTGVSKPGG